MGLVVILVINSVPNLLRSVRLGPMATGRVFYDVVIDFLWQASALYLLFGVADFMMMRRSFMNDAKMTDEDLKEEQKDTEGNVAARWKFRMMALMRAAEDRKPQANPSALAELLNMGQRTKE
jgi:flagellar biosynthetic protein FlhB